MKKTLEFIIGIISGIGLISHDSIAINFAEEAHNIPIGTFMRNIRIFISSNKGEEKYNKFLMQLDFKQSAKRLEICFSNNINLRGKKAARTKLTKAELTKGDIVLLMYDRHLLGKFIIREDYERKLNEM